MASALAWVAPARRELPAIAGVSIAVFGTGLAGATLALDWLDRDAPPWLPGLSQGWTVAVQMVVEGLGLLTVSMVAAAVVWRQPRNRISWAIGGTALLLVTMVFSGQYAIHGLLVAPGSIPLAEAAARLQLLIAPVLVGAIWVFLMFPDGRLKSPRWRLLVLLTPAIYFVDMIGRLDNPYPLNVSLVGQQLVPVSMPPSAWPVGALVSCAGPWVGWAEAALAITVAMYLVLRLAAAEGEARLQLKWFTYSVAILAVTVVVGQINSPLLRGLIDINTAQIVWIWSVMGQLVTGTVLLPAAIGMAMLRYRLYDIDVVISRTILYGGLAVFVTGTYGIVVGGIGSLLGQHAGSSPLLTILAIALAAALLEPVRARLQGLANVAIYGRRTSPYQVLSDFARGIGRAEPSNVVLPRMAQLLREGTGAATAEVWVRVGDRLHRAATSPADPGAARAVGGLDELTSRTGTIVAPVFHDGQVLGALTLTKARGEKINLAEQRLLDDLTSQAGLVFSRYRLVEELRESRTRIVAAEDLERRRLQRNLHDGAQQRFVNALLAMGLAKADGSAGAPELLETATSEVRAGLAELRNLARGLHPALLAESGLRAAIGSLADRVPILTTVHGAADRRYPEPVEVTAYYIVAEALSNAAKHSGASAIDVRIGESGGWLRIEIADDGVGGADTTRGSGLIGLQDRVSAVGGSVAVHSPPGGGTVVTAELPCG